MRSYQCPFCTTVFSEADKAWDAAIDSGRCPTCLESLLNFPSSLPANPQEHKSPTERLEPQTTPDVAAATSTMAFSAPPRSPVMTRIAATVALFQAGYMLFVMLGAIESPITASGQPAIDARNIWSIAGAIAEATLMVGFAIALLKRHVWGAFGLFGDAALNTLVKPFILGFGAFVGSLIPLVIYWVGTQASLNSEYKRPHLYELKWREIIRYGLLVFVGWQSVAFIFGFLGFRKDMAMMPEYWIILSTWLISVLALAAKYDTQWGFETVLCVSIIGNLLSLVTDVPFLVMHEGVDLGSALIDWDFNQSFVIAFGVVACGVASVLPLPIVAPGEAAKGLFGIHLRTYDYKGVMSDTRRLLLILGTIYILFGFYLFKGGQAKEFVQDNWLELVVMGIVFATSALTKSFWFRFVCISIWTADLIYTSMFATSQIRPSMFIPVGAYFVYQMWSHRRQIVAARKVPRPDVSDQPVEGPISE